MVAFAPLYATSIATVDANGNVTLTIEGPRLDRVWLGTFMVSGSTAGTTWTITVGGVPYGTLLAPGPGGPYQLFRGLKLVATAAGLVSGTLITGILAGTDFAKDISPPYIGPTSVTSVNSGGP